jgi:hypothetical protein
MDFLPLRRETRLLGDTGFLAVITHCELAVIVDGQPSTANPWDELAAATCLQVFYPPR